MKNDTPLAPSLSPPGGEKVAEGRVRGFKLLVPEISMNQTKITVEAIRAMKARGEKIAALTAYDFPMTKLLDEAGIPLHSRRRFAGHGCARLSGHDARDDGRDGASRPRRRPRQTARIARRGPAVSQLRNRGGGGEECKTARRRRRGICEGRGRTKNSAAGPRDYFRRNSVLRPSRHVAATCAERGRLPRQRQNRSRSTRLCWTMRRRWPTRARLRLCSNW